MKSSEHRPLVGLLSNPHSGRNLSRLKQIDRLVGRYPRVHHYHTDTPEAIGPALEKLAKKGVEVIAINGGDGTTSQVFTHLLDHSPFPRLPLLALLPGGTSNVNAGDVGLCGNLLTAVKHLCQWSEGRYVKTRLDQRAILRVRHGQDERARYGMIFGTGSIIRGIEYTRKRFLSRGIRNPAVLGYSLARSVWGTARRDPRFAHPVPVTVTLDENEKGSTDAPEDTLLLLISSLDQLFFGIRPHWGDQDGPLHVTRIGDNPDRLLRAMPEVFRGRPSQYATPDAGYFSHNAKRICLQMNAAYVLDGEIFHATPDSGPVVIDNGGHATFIRLQ